MQKSFVPSLLRRVVRSLIVLVGFTACASPPVSPESTAALAIRVDSLETTLGEVQDDVAASGTQLGSLEEERLRAGVARVPSCYGRGHDAIFRDLGGTHAEARDLLGGCFSEDVQTDFYFFDGATPTHLDGLDALIGFIDGFASSTGYHTARNTPGNVSVEMTGSSSARVVSSGTTPHFSRLPATAGDPAFVDMISARYVNEVTLGSDGVWRTTVFTIHVDEIWRAEGAFPMGQ